MKSKLDYYVPGALSFMFFLIGVYELIRFQNDGTVKGRPYGDGSIDVLASGILAYVFLAIYFIISLLMGFVAYRSFKRFQD